MGVGGQRHTPAVLTAGNRRYPLYRRLGGPRGRSGQGRKSRPPHGFDVRTVQPVARRYTCYAISPQFKPYLNEKYLKLSDTPRLEVILCA